MEISSDHLHSQTVRARELKFCEKDHLPPPVICHLSPVTFHLSHVTCLVTNKNCEACWLRVCYQRGIPYIVIVSEQRHFFSASFFVIIPYLYFVWAMYTFESLEQTFYKQNILRNQNFLYENLRRNMHEKGHNKHGKLEHLCHIVSETWNLCHFFLFSIVKNMRDCMISAFRKSGLEYTNGLRVTYSAVQFSSHLPALPWARWEDGFSLAMGKIGRLQAAACRGVKYILY